MKMPIVHEVTMYCKCQLDHLIPLKCVCVKPIVRVLGKSQTALMKFFLDCSDYSHHRASFEGLKESTVFLNVKAFVGLKDGHSSHGVGCCYVRLVVLRCNHHPWVGAEKERKR